MGKKKIIKAIVISVCLALVSLKSFCFNNDEIKWEMADETSCLCFEETEQILKWAAEPWTAVFPYSIVSASNNIVVIEKIIGSGIQRALFLVFVKYNGLYQLYAYSLERVILTRLNIELADSNELILYDMDREIGRLKIEQKKLNTSGTAPANCHIVPKDIEYVTINNNSGRRRIIRSYAQYDGIIKGKIVERKDLLYFNGGDFGYGGAISAIKVKVISSFGVETDEDNIWIYPDTTCLNALSGIINFGFHVSDALFYFGLEEKQGNYVYQLDDFGFMNVLNDNQVYAFSSIFDKMKGRKRFVQKDRFEHKLIRKYK